MIFHAICCCLRCLLLFAGMFFLRNAPVCWCLLLFVAVCLCLLPFAESSSDFGLKMAPRGPKMAPKMVPKCTQNGLQMAPWSAQGPPRANRALILNPRLQFGAHFGTQPGPLNRQKSIVLQKGSPQSIIFYEFCGKCRCSRFLMDFGSIFGAPEP